MRCKVDSSENASSVCVVDDDDDDVDGTMLLALVLELLLPVP